MDVISHALSGALIGRALCPAEKPEAQVAMTVLGALAGMAPDLDFLFELRGKLAAWRYHRVAFHGIPLVPVLAAPLIAAAFATDARAVGALRIVLTVVAGIVTHLLLDVVTSFGTALFFPFSRRRFSTRSHFIMDPIVLCILAGGFVADRAVAALAALAIYMLASHTIRVWLTRKARAALVRLGYRDPRPVLEPRLLSPWRWMVLLDRGDEYLIGQATPLAVHSKWRRTDSGRRGSAATLAERSALLRAFLATCDFPRFELRSDRTLIVEDVKWWLQLPLRPLLFTSLVDEQGVPTSPRQSKMTDRGPMGTDEEPPINSVRPAR
jgi:inner membrane protein